MCKSLIIAMRLKTISLNTVKYGAVQERINLLPPAHTKAPRKLLYAFKCLKTGKLYSSECRFSSPTHPPSPRTPTLLVPPPPPPRQNEDVNVNVSEALHAGAKPEAATLRSRGGDREKRRGSQLSAIHLEKSR